MSFEREGREHGADLKLGKILGQGGSSIVYELSGGRVAKEALSPIGRDIVGTRTLTKKMLNEIALRESALSSEEKREFRDDAERAKVKLENNLELTKKYLGNFLARTELLVRENRNGVPVVTILQDMLPNDHITFHPDGWDIIVTDEIRANLRQLIDAIETMYRESRVMIDLLTLQNVAYSASTKKFYIYDIDPLICAKEDEAQLNERYNVDNRIDHEFVTHNDNTTQDALEANLEHLEALKSLLSVPDREA